MAGIGNITNKAISDTGNESGGFMEFLASGKEKLDNFQRDLASVLPAIPGQPAGKYQDIAIGIDMHPTIFPPSPVMAVPHVGMVFDIMGAIFAAINSFIPPPPEPPEPEEGEEMEPQPVTVSSVCVAIVKALAPSVMVNNKFIANAGVSIQHLPGIFVHALPTVSPMASSEMFMGSSTVLADGAPFSYQFLPALSCNLIGIPAPIRPAKMKPKMSLMAPTAALVNVIPGGKPVLVGGPPTIDLLALAMNLGLKGIGKLWKKAGGGKLTKFLKSLLPKNPIKKNWLQSIKCKMFGEPVDAATGRVYAENTDFSLPGPIPLEWNRIYHSDGEIESPIGSNWHHSYYIGYWVMNNDFITLLLPDSREIVVPPLHIGDTFYHRSEKITWFKDEKGYGYRNSEGLIYRFSSIKQEGNFYPIAHITNDLGFKIQFAYRGNVLSRIIDSAGRLLDVTSNGNGRITGVSTMNKDQLIHLIRYEIDEKDNLVKVTDANDVSKHFYYEGHLLVRLTNQSGLNFYWEYEGHGDNAKCIHTWGDDGILEYWTQYEKGKTITTNSLGHTTTYYYDASNLIYRITDAKQGETYQTYNDHQDLMMVADPLGNTTKYNYDRNGNLVLIENANKEKTLLAYDKDNRLIEYNTPGGGYLEWIYDEQGKLIERGYADGTYTKYQYENEFLKTIEDQKGRKTTLHWDDTNYNLQKVSLHDGATMRWHYDAMGQVLKHTNISGQVTSYTYDAMGNVTGLREPDRNEHTFAYDASGNVTKAADRTRSVEFTYWGLGNLKTRKENDSTITFHYNTEEQLTAIVNEKNEMYRFGLDALGQVVAEWGFDGLQRRYVRDRGGRIRKVLRPDERWTRYQYDGVGNILTANHYDGTGENFMYDADGKLTEATNPFNTVKLTYDKGRVIEELQNEHLVESNYNNDGNRVQLTSSLGADITHEFGASGDLIRTASQGWEAQFKRDNMGLEISRIVSGGVVTKTQRDKKGRVIGHNIQAKNIEGRNMSYRWGSNDQLLSITNHVNNKKTNFGYDETGNLQFAKYSSLETLYKMPDAVGNLFKSKGQNDNVYTKGGQLKKDKKASYTYDAEGNLSTKFIAMAKNPQDVGEWSYEWYGNGMLKAVKTPAKKEIIFEYDALGRRTAKIVKYHPDLENQNRTNKITRFIWDGNTPLHEWTYNLEDKPKLYVNADGEIASKDQEPTDASKQTTWLFEGGSFVPAAKIVGERRYSIICDYLGTPVQAYDEEGEKVWDCELDIYGNVRNIEGHKTFIPFRYQGQYEDEETGLYYNRFRYYSPDSGTYISQDPIGLAGGNKLYAYTHDTNTWVDAFGLSEGIASIQQTINSVLEAHLPQIQAIDPNASVGYRGSAASGISKAHDPNLSRAINPNSFDVDGFIQSDYLANSDAFTNRRREASKISGMADIEASIDRELRKALPNNNFKNEPFEFRIFKSHELADMARKGDVQVKIHSH